MKIIQHLVRSNTADFILYRLTPADWRIFVSKLTDEFRLCYISNKQLQKLARKNRISKSQLLEKYILPDDPTIKSGDYGELLSFSIVQEHFSNNGYFLFAPRKWRWKEDRNRAMLGVDAILFYFEKRNKISNKDFLVTIEAKMKAVHSNEHRIQTAINGATEDKLSRLVKSLNWLEEKYAKLGQRKKKSLIERFKDPSTYGKYTKIHKAIAILDKTLETNETGKAITNKEGVKVIVVSIDDLKKTYEDCRTNIIASV